MHVYMCFLARPHTTRGPSRVRDGHEGREYPVLNGVLFLCCKEGVCQWQPIPFSFLCFAWQCLGLFLSVVHGSVLACVMRVAVVCLCVAQRFQCSAGVINGKRKSKVLKSFPSLPLPWPLPLVKPVGLACSASPESGQ